MFNREMTGFTARDASFAMLTMSPHDASRSVEPRFWRSASSDRARSLCRRARASLSSTRMGRCGSSTRSYSGCYRGVTISVGASTVSLTCSRTGGASRSGRGARTRHPRRGPPQAGDDRQRHRHRADLARQPPLAGRAQPRRHYIASDKPVQKAFVESLNAAPGRMLL